MYDAKIANSSILFEAIHNTERDKKYKDYLNSHISGVKQAYDDCFKGKLDGILTKEEIFKLETNIDNHDKSKYTDIEWNPYLDFFYPEEGKQPEDSRKEFDYACLHHYHQNPHHWNHWVLNDDEDKNKDKVLDMDPIYIVEMLCDWHSFSLKNSESTGATWWENNQSKMKISENTIKLVNKFINFVKEPLSKGVTNETTLLTESISDFKEKHNIKCDSNNCTGYSEKEGKYYGWSHRAIYGFKIGDKCKEGDCGVGKGYHFQPGDILKTFEDTKQRAEDFASSVD